MTTSAVGRIVEFLCGDPADLPRETLHGAKRVLVNGLRAAIVARSLPVSGHLANALDRGAGSGHQGLIFGRERAEPLDAASFSAFLWSVLLLDEIHLESGLHPGAPAASAAMAAGARSGRSGREVLAALVRGVEVQTCLARAMAPEMRVVRGFAPISVLAPLGAACATLPLAESHSAKAMADAVAIAAMSGVGVWEQGGTLSSNYLVAAATRSGMAACDMAALGVNGPDSAIDGEFGSFRAYSGKDPEQLGAALDELGRRWSILALVFQPYSGDTLSQAALVGAASLVDRLGVLAETAVRAVDVTVHPRGQQAITAKQERHVDLTDAFQLNSDPAGRIACALLRASFSFGPSFDDLVADAEVRSLRRRVRFHPDEAMAPLTEASISLTLADGTAHSAHVPAFIGSPANPMSDVELTSSFLAASAPALGDARSEHIAELVWRMDELDDLSEVIGLLHD